MGPEAPQAAPIAPHLPGLAIELRYGLSHLGKVMLWHSLEVYALFYLTDIAGIDARLAGIVFMAMLAIDAVANLTVGVVFDSLKIARRPSSCVLVLTPALILLFVLSFAGQAVAAPWAWSILFMQLTRLLFVMVDVPHNAVLLRLVAQGQSDTRLATLRHAAGLGGILLVGGLSLVLAGRTLDGGSFQLLIWSIAALAGGLLLLTPKTVAEAGQVQSSPAPRPKAGDTAGLVRNRFVLLVLALGLIVYTGNSLVAHSLPFAAKLMADNAKLTGQILLALTVVKVLATPITWFGIRRTSEITTGLVVTALFGTAGLCLASGTGAMTSWLALLFAIGLADTAMTIVGWTLVMRAHASLLRSGTDRPATLTALFTSMGRLGSGLSGLILSSILALPSAAFTGHLGIAIAVCSLAALMVLLALAKAQPRLLA